MQQWYVLYFFSAPVMFNIVQDITFNVVSLRCDHYCSRRYNHSTRRYKGAIITTCDPQHNPLPHQSKVLSDMQPRQNTRVHSYRCLMHSGICEMGLLDPSHKSHNALDKYPTKHHCVPEMFTGMCNRDLWNRSNVVAHYCPCWCPKKAIRIHMNEDKLTQTL